MSDSVSPPTIEVRISDVIGVHAPRLMDCRRFNYVEFVWQIDSGMMQRKCVFAKFSECTDSHQVEDELKGLLRSNFGDEISNRQIQCIFGKYRNGVNLLEEA